MTEPFFITVPYKNAEKQIELQLEVTGYTHRFKAMVDEIPVYFEPDEERQYRAVLMAEHAASGKSLDPVLLQAIAEILVKELS